MYMPTLEGEFLSTNQETKETHKVTLRNGLQGGGKKSKYRTRYAKGGCAIFSFRILRLFERFGCSTLGVIEPMPAYLIERRLNSHQEMRSSLVIGGLRLGRQLIAKAPLVGRSPSVSE